MAVSGQPLVPAALLLGKELSNNHWTAGRVGPKTGLDTLEKRKSLPPPGIQTPDRPACSPASTTTMVSHMLYCILSQFKTLHVLITQGLNSLVTIYVYSLFGNIETERTYVHLCATNRETDACDNNGSFRQSPDPTTEHFIYIHDVRKEPASEMMHISTKIGCWKAIDCCVSIILHHKFSDSPPPPFFLLPVLPPHFQV